MKALLAAKKEGKILTSASPESGYSSKDVGQGLRAPVRLRCRADAAQHQGRTLQQLRKESSPRARNAQHRLARDETYGRQFAARRPLPSNVCTMP